MSIKLPKFIYKAYYKLLGHKMMRFLVVGGTGFIVNYILLTIFYHILKLPAVLAQAISAEIVLLATFVGNNYWSFGGHHHISVKKKLIKYNITSGVGLILNITTFTLLIKYAHLYYGLALVGGTSIGLVWNYTFNIKVVFKQQQDKSTD